VGGAEREDAFLAGLLGVVMDEEEDYDGESKF
jgi:hypothetical protein